MRCSALFTLHVSDHNVLVHEIRVSVWLKGKQDGLCRKKHFNVLELILVQMVNNASFCEKDGGQNQTAGKQVLLKRGWWFPAQRVT